jgi:hypothetical protein
MYVLEPDVSISYGENSIVDRGVNPAKIEHAHIVVEEDVDDAIMTTSPFFIFTKALADDIGIQKMTGVQFDEVEVSVSKKFVERMKREEKSISLPELCYAKVEISQGNDFNRVDGVYGLVISQNARNLVEKHGLKYGIIKPYDK